MHNRHSLIDLYFEKKKKKTKRKEKKRKNEGRTSGVSDQFPKLIRLRGTSSREERQLVSQIASGNSQTVFERFVLCLKIPFLIAVCPRIFGL